MLKFILALAVVLGQGFAESSTEQDLQKFEASLDWKEAGNYPLPLSNSTLILPEEHVVLIGKDADALRVFWGDSPNPSIEAISYTAQHTEPVIFSFHSEGYISLEDWSDVDPQALLQSYIENTERENKERKQKGLRSLHVLGWLQEPTLDKETHTVYWALEAVANGDEEHFVNSFALRLGRFGYEELIWITDKKSYISKGGELDLMLKAHSFDKGFRYTDYVSGDKVAAYGIAALVAASIGVKVLKTGGLLLLIKKFGAVFIAACAAVFYKIRAWLKKDDQSDPLD